MIQYKGKDYVKQGYLVNLDLATWDKMEQRARRAVRKANNLGLTVFESKSSSKIKHILFPKKLKRKQRCYYALNKDGKVIAGVVIEFFNSSLLYRYAVSKEEGKKSQANIFLIWQIVSKFSNTRYRYLDLGTSYRKDLDFFKKQFSGKTYPVIYNPPMVKPQIRLDPYYNNQQIPTDTKNVEQKIEEYFGKEFTLLPDGKTAIYLVLKKLGLGKKDVVTINTSFNTTYVRRDVTDQIELVCKHSRKITEKTKAIYVIHEWGFPVENIEELREYATKKNITLIEDCAHSITTLIKNKRIGTFGNYSIYSFPRVFPCQYGGMLLGISVDENEQQKLEIFDYEKREILKRTLGRDLGNILEYESQRIKNYQYLDEGFKMIGLLPFKELQNGIVPHAYILNSNSSYKLVERLKLFGIEAGVYHQLKAVIIPVHQNLNSSDLNYILGVVKSYYF